MIMIIKPLRHTLSLSVCGREEEKEEEVVLYGVATMSKGCMRLRL